MPKLIVRQGISIKAVIVFALLHFLAGLVSYYFIRVFDPAQQRYVGSSYGLILALVFTCEWIQSGRRPEDPDEIQYRLSVIVALEAGLLVFFVF